MKLLEIGCVGMIGVIAGGAFGGGGTVFDASTMYQLDFTTGRNRDVHFADLNGDGKADVLYWIPGTYSFQVAIGQGDGSFVAGSVCVVDQPDGVGLRESELLDIDLDGDLDLVLNQTVVTEDPFIGVELYSWRLTVCENDGDGSFVDTLEAVEYDGSYKFGGTFLMMVGDFDGDGLRDEVGMSDLAQEWIFVYGWDDGWVSRGTIDDIAAPIPAVTDGVVSVDYDLDGDDDLVFQVKATLPYLAVYENQGGYSFVESAILDTGPNIVMGLRPYGVYSGDLDGDSYDELIVFNQSTTVPFYDEVRVFSNNGGGFMTGDVGEIYPVGEMDSPTSGGGDLVAVGDIDLDGVADLAVNGNLGDQSVWWYRSDPMTGLALAEMPAIGRGDVRLVDINADGALDLVVCRYGQQPRVVLNRLGGSVCEADLTGDGELDFFDLSELLMSGIDYNGDTSFDFFDISVYLQDYSEGCP